MTPHEKTQSAIEWLKIKPCAVDSSNHPTHATVHPGAVLDPPSQFAAEFTDALHDAIADYLEMGEYDYYNLSAAADLRGIEEGRFGTEDEIGSSAAGTLVKIHAELGERHIAI